MRTSKNQHNDAFDTLGSGEGLTVKWHECVENAMPGRREGQEKEPR